MTEVKVEDCTFTIAPVTLLVNMEEWFTKFPRYLMVQWDSPHGAFRTMRGTGLTDEHLTDQVKERLARELAIAYDKALEQ